MAAPVASGVQQASPVSFVVIAVSVVDIAVDDNDEHRIDKYRYLLPWSRQTSTIVDAY
jgi:hypothetical protein